ncbi:hypothetical protein MPDQ_000846 [Monascus purpureus]|uniref:Uracil-DNA glycosylase-like domain-containing protein n=1 Tax=Monascus purpureus TaxID=5098 RepID=A0A507R4C2_MONPU|nr:hypothetical protein MPDQ_000846 [Monascus purpureus]
MAYSVSPVDATNGADDLYNKGAEEDVPVNKKTSFNGRLNQYFHISKPQDPASIDSRTPTDSPKRKLATSSEGGTSMKRTKPILKTTTTTTIARVTRSSSSSRSSTPSPSARSTTTRRKSALGTTPSPQKAPSPPSSSVSLLRDTIPPNLVLLLVGVNPGIMTGVTGFAYAHPSNLFWKLLHSSGITSIRHPPSDTYKLPELYSVGNTNIVERPTRDASMLSKAEMNAGVPVLEAKVASQRPEAVCLVGKSIWEAVWRVRKGRAIRKEEFRYGWQDEEENMGKGDGWKGAPVFVATTTSGLAAGMSMQEKEAVWAELGKWVVRRREERAASAAATVSKGDQ